MDKSSSFMVLYVMIILLVTGLSDGLLCYRCDSQVEEDCQFYPAPMSTYEDCDERPPKSTKELKQAYKKNLDTPVEEETQPIYLRYRYKLCPLVERTIKHVVPIDFCESKPEKVETESPTAPVKSPSPMDGVNYVCGKAVTHGPNGIRIRRGCTPDLFLNGSNACVTHKPHGATDVACFCTTDLCNHGNRLHHERRMTSTLYLIGIVTVGRIIEQSFI